MLGLGRYNTSQTVVHSARSALFAKGVRRNLFRLETSEKCAHKYFGDARTHNSLAVDVVGQMVHGGVPRKRHQATVANWHLRIARMRCTREFAVEAASPPCLGSRAKLGASLLLGSSTKKRRSVIGIKLAVLIKLSPPAVRPGE